MNRVLVTVRKACEALGVSRRTVYNWMDSGKLPYVRTPGGARRIYEDDLVRPPHPGRPAGGAAALNPQ